MGLVDVTKIKEVSIWKGSGPKVQISYFSGSMHTIDEIVEQIDVHDFEIYIVTNQSKLNQVLESIYPKIIRVHYELK